MKSLLTCILVMLLLSAGTGWLYGQAPDKTGTETNKLTILWATGDKEVFTKMMYIYILNARKQDWFDKVTVVVWGPSARLLAGDKEIQGKVKEFERAGVIMEACSWCTGQYGVTEDLKDLGVDVKGMGGPLTRYIKDPGTEVLVF